MGLRRAFRNFWLSRAKSITYHGLSVPMQRPGMSPNIARHLDAGLYEAPEIRGVEAVVRAGDRVLELGAGLGIVTAIAARKAGGGRVLSYEANPEMVEATRKFLADNGVSNVDLRGAVLSPEPVQTGQMMTFYLAASFAEGSLRGGSEAGGRRVEVPAESLAAIVAEFRPDVLVCDIEGAEAELVPALDAAGLRAAVIELHPDRLARREVARIYSSLAAHGLFPEIENSGGTVVTFSRVEPN